MGPSHPQQPVQHRPVATAPANQLEQAVGAMEVLGSLQQQTLQQQMPHQPVTGGSSTRQPPGGARATHKHTAAAASLPQTAPRCSPACCLLLTF